MDLRAFRIRLTHWEYWPFIVVYLPVFAYWLWLSLKSGSLLYFTASNTLMKNGGMLGESKNDIYSKLPRKFVPKTSLIHQASDTRILTRIMTEYSFPVIAKPDIGERGRAVSKIASFEELERYHDRAKYSYLLQEYINLPLETGIFYYRFPGEKKGTVSSIVYKELLSVTGNGKDTLEELICRKDRAYLHRHVLKERFGDYWTHVPQHDERIVLEEIGNHSRGTKFLSGNHRITPELTEVFNRIADELEGFFFGRFDIRSASWDDLEKGRFFIMELNGGGSEPGHIYDPAVSVTDAYKSIFHHWKVLYNISRANHKRGIPYLTFQEGLHEYRKVLEIKRRTSQT